MIKSELRIKFKRLYKEKFNIDLSEEETTQLFGDFINLMTVIFQPNSESKDTKSFQKEKNQYENI